MVAVPSAERPAKRQTFTLDSDDYEYHEEPEDWDSYLTRQVADLTVDEVQPPAVVAKCFCSFLGPRGGRCRNFTVVGDRCARHAVRAAVGVEAEVVAEISQSLPESPPGALDALIAGPPRQPLVVEAIRM